MNSNSSKIKKYIRTIILAIVACLGIYYLFLYTYNQQYAYWWKVQEIKLQSSFAQNKNAKANIVFVVPDLMRTGAQMMMVRLAKMLKKHNYNVAVVYKDIPILSYELDKISVLSIRLKMTRANYKSYLSFLKNNFDLAITSCDEILFEHSKISQNMPTIWWAHKVDNITEEFLQWRDDELIIDRDEWYFNPVQTIKSSDIVSVSELARKNLLKTGISPEHVSVIINGVSTDDITESLQTPSSDLYQHLEQEKEPDKMMFIYVGRAVKDKGISVFVKAIASLPEEYAKKSIFYFVGKNDMRYAQRLMRRCRNLENVVWIGEKKQETMWDYYRAADVMVVPSIGYDAAPNVIAEAAMYHMPSIMTTKVGSTYLIENGKSGFIVEPNDVKALREKIMWAIDNPQKVKEMGKYAYQKFLQTSTPELFWKGWEQKISQKLQENKKQVK